MIAFLGMGLLGSNFVKALLKKGEQVQVWNRTTARATALETAGAKAFSNAADAVKGAGRIHSFFYAPYTRGPVNMHIKGG